MDGVPILIVFVITLTGHIVDCADCNSKFSDAAFHKDFGYAASSEATSNKATDVFTVGWCSGTSNGSPNIDIDFKQPYGISSIQISGPTNKGDNSYPTNVLVKYVPNGGNNFVHFPVQGGKLEINMTQPGTVQTNLGQGIAAKKLQFTIQSFHVDACLKIDLVGCTIKDLCTGECQNGGLCLFKDTCQCPQGYLGKHCEQKACVPTDLGLADGTIGVDQIQVSSEDPINNKAEIGNDASKKGWCPSASDNSPWVQIKLDQPKAVSVFSFMWSAMGSNNIMTEFDLQYIAPIDSAKRFRTFATDIPAMNSTHIFTVTIQPVVVTDTIRIVSSKSTGRACFKLEVQGCDPKELCSTGWCQNGGTCMGDNVCLCPSGFVGSRCEQSNNDITVTNMTFVKIENNVLVTTSTTFQFLISGNVNFQMVANKPVVTINGSASHITLNQTTGTPSCVTDVNLCTNGFTFTIDINFGHLIDNTFIVSSGGHLPGHSGITLYYTHQTLTYIVSTTTQVWTLVVNYQPVLNKWQHFEITWNKHLGVELLINGHSLGSNSRPTDQSTTTKQVDLCIGCSHTTINVNINMQITAIHTWSIDRTELVNAGVKEPPADTTTSMPSTVTTVAQTTTTVAKPSTTAAPSTTTQRATTAATSTTKPTVECVPIDLGLADGRIKPDNITVSSQDIEYTKAEIGNSASKKGWCPSKTDNSPWVQIKLDKPEAVSVFKFWWSDKGNTDIMTEFELQYISPIDSTKRFRTFSKDIPSLNSTHVLDLFIQPVVVTDTLRIIASKWNGTACFKLELQGCDPKVLCSPGWCENGGTCMGENVCLCPSGFFGSRCEQTANQITVTNMTFVKIENNVIITTSTTLEFLVTGNIQLEVVETKPVVTINGSDSFIKLNQTTGVPSCVTDVNLCTNGFTLTIDINFNNLLDNTYIVSSGGYLPDHSGITLYYTNKQLHYIVSTTTMTWTLVVNYQPVLHQWQHFEITWNTHLGVELLINGHSLGSNSRPDVHHTTTQTANLCIGCSHSTTIVNINMQITAIFTWSIDRTELVNAGVKDPPVTATTPLPSTTSEITTAKPTTLPATSPRPFLEYNLTFVTIIDNILITPTFNFTLHNKPILELQNNSHTAIVLDCSKQQYVELPDQGIPCLEDLNNCTEGFTFNLEVMFTKLEPAKKAYILSSGGDVPGTSGMAIYVHNSKLIFGVKQGFQHWTGTYDMTAIIKTNIWYKLEVSWSAAKGVLVLIDGYEVIRNNQRTPSPVSAVTHPVLIGKTDVTNETSCMKVRDLFTWTTEREVLVDHGIVQAPKTTLPTTTTTTTTQATTTIPTTTKLPIPTYTWNFTSITDNIIIGSQYNLTVHGSPIVFNGTIQINSSTQYIEFGSHQNNCLIKPESCLNGLTIQFTIQFNQFKENTYFFTSGGQLPDGVGLAVIYRFGKLQFVLTTATQSWFINCGKNQVRPNTFHTIMLSWQLTTGLEVFVNNVLIEATKVPTPHQSVLMNATTVYFGKQPTTSINVDFLLQTITIWYVHIDILVEQGICKPPTRPTTSTPTLSTKTTTATPEPSASTSRATFSSMLTKTSTQQCPAGCVSITTAQSQSTTKQAVTTAKTPVTTAKPPVTTAQTPVTATSQKVSTTAPTTKPKPSATTSSFVPTPDTATPPPPTTRNPIPDFSQIPNINVTVEKDKNAYVACTFKPTAQKDIQIKVSLVVESKVQLVLTVGGNTGVAMFAVSKIDMFLYRKQIQCSVSAHYIGSAQTTQTFYSIVYTPQITVKPDRLIVIEGHSTEFVTVTSTAPPQFYCCIGCKGECQIHIVGSFHYDRQFQKCGKQVIAQAVIESAKPPNFNENICGYALTITNWNQQNKIQVKATIDGRRDRDHTNQLDIIANVYHQPQTAQITVTPNSLTIDTVQVTVKDNDHAPAQCKSVNDPHMTTFDGQRYNNMKEGEFVLFRHTRLPFEVRAVYYKCSKRSHATCNCAVSVKSGDDIITVTGCQGTVSGGHPGQGHGVGLLLQQLFGTHGHAHGHGHKDELAKTPMTIQIYKNGALTPGTYIRRIGCGQKYEIELPTGMVITVQQSWKPFINIWIKASSSDRHESEGLCGNFDGSKSNDLKPNVNAVINKWTASGNFFYGVGVSSHSVTSMYCSCVKGRDRVCLAGLGALRCSTSRYDITATLVRQAKLPALSRHKRQADTEPTVPAPVIPTDDTDVTLEEAEKKCENEILNSRITKSCMPILTSNLTEQIENCAHDYNATGNFEWATDAMRDIIVDCVEAVNTINDIREANGTGANVTDEVDIPDNIDEILNNLEVCVEDCGMNGNCTDGVCVCEDGYSGISCEISKETRPTVIATSFLCDVIDTSDCTAAPVYGDNFVESGSLTCHYEFIKVGDSVVSTGEKGQVRAIYISINHVTCPLPREQSARISVSNDGNTRSNETTTHVVYHPVCFDCTVEPACTRKEDNCLINDVCYESNATRTGDICQICRPVANSTAWSINHLNECISSPMAVMKDNDKEKKQILILAIVCGVLAAIVFIGCIYCIRARMGKKSTKDETGEYDFTSSKKHYRDPAFAQNPVYFNEKL